MGSSYSGLRVNQWCCLVTEIYTINLKGLAYKVTPAQTVVNYSAPKSLARKVQFKHLSLIVDIKTNLSENICSPHTPLRLRTNFQGVSHVFTQTLFGFTPSQVHSPGVLSPFWTRMAYEGVFRVLPHLPH